MATARALKNPLSSMVKTPQISQSFARKLASRVGASYNRRDVVLEIQAKTIVGGSFMTRSRIFVATFALAIGLCGVVSADVSLPKIFGDHMVLQQDRENVPVWGKASPGEKVVVVLGDAKGEATAGDDGKWMVRLKTPKASDKAYTLVIEGKNRVAFEDVLVGEVWVASGQSNMEWSVKQSDNPEKEAENAKFPQIRMIKVQHNAAAEPQDDVNAKWVVCSPESVPAFSAVGYFFARKLHQELKVPVGIISTNWGGTIAEAWTSRETLENDPDFDQILQRGKQFKPGQPNHASVLYNGMIHPIIPYGIRGAIWYQGESNRSRAQQYTKLFPAMIADWRKLWGQGDFPFYFVQLAPYKYDKNKDAQELPELWEAQTKTLTASKNTGMAVTTDIGNLADIHPKNKQDVGARLALWALAKDYGKEVAFSGPIYESSAVEGNKIRVKFKYAESGLEAKSGDPQLFTIAGEDQKFVPAKAQIDGATVVVWSDEVAKPVAVRYGWTEWAEPEKYNLYNKAGLPASPFRTDEFPQLTAGRK
jgi:sialate O-acetylesterase